MSHKLTFSLFSILVNHINRISESLDRLWTWLVFGVSPQNTNYDHGGVSSSLADQEKYSSRIGRMVEEIRVFGFSATDRTTLLQGRSL